MKHMLANLALSGIATFAHGVPADRPAVTPVPFTVQATMRDRAELLSPSAVKLEGYLGARCLANARNRLARVDEGPLLAGFRHKPGSHPWIGEHAGKWLHAATLAWAYSGDAALREKLDRFAADLIATQEADGYLGTYVPDERFGLFRGADWDVWSHKYCLMGLLTYYQYTGNTNALEACRRVGDLLARTFGPGRKSIISAGTHVGMAATSVLEPMMLLYRFTGDPRYLDFGTYIVKAWDEPNGPKILATLLEEKNVRETVNGKAYEMLSNLVGLCELARVTGNKDDLRACLNAWDDITARRLYLSGSTSSFEHFQDDFVLPNGPDAHICETCVSVTWIQLNLQLLRLTGDAKYANELDRTLYNHLAAAQRPDGAEWCYYTPLEGHKPYGPGINCCVSSGPRGMALAPTFAFAKRDFGGTPGLAVVTFESAVARVRFGERDVDFTLSSDFPRAGTAELTIESDAAAAFPIAFRDAPWAAPIELRVNGGEPVAAGRDSGWLVLPSRTWRRGDRVSLRFSLGATAVRGEHDNTGKTAMTWGPFVLAYDEDHNPGLPRVSSVGFAESNGGIRCVLRDGPEPAFVTLLRSTRRPAPFEATLVPFADAGARGGAFRVWLPSPETELRASGSLLEDGTESRSRTGNIRGSINDGDIATRVCTFDGTKADQDWYAVSLPAPATITRIAFAHGHSFHDGGWFDASAGRPRLQVQHVKNGPWQTVAELSQYPPTTATDAKGIRDRQRFEEHLPKPVTVIAVRIVGKPSCGDNPNQAFTSCGELEAF